MMENNTLVVGIDTLVVEVDIGIDIGKKAAYYALLLHLQ
jgi:hypothetical protein